MNKKFMIGWLAAATAIALASLVTLGWTLAKVKAYEKNHDCRILAADNTVCVNDLPSASETHEEQKKADAPQAGADESPDDIARREIRAAAKAAGGRSSDGERPGEPQMKVVDVDYDGDSRLDIHLSDRPDMDAVRRYIEVSPLNEGVVSFSYKAVYNYKTGSYEPHLHVYGDFAYRTDVKLLIRKGLPLYGKSADIATPGALAEDWTMTFRRKDADPLVKFASEGRYLPPGGARAIGVEAVNVTNVHAEIRRVEPRNVVQLLARDEGVYSNTWHQNADEEATGELSGEAETNIVRCANKANVKETLAIPLSMRDGGLVRGVFLVTVRSADIPRKDYGYCMWSDDKTPVNPNRYRLVCVSDLGLSVRRAGDSTGVWVTSLTTGRPVPDAWVEVYSAANIRVAEGRTDANGWCSARRVAKGEPFAVVVISENADDMSFMALRSSMEVDETYPGGARDEYLKARQCTAFVWSERGIYRHGEKIFVHALLRDGTAKAPSPFPVELVLRNPQGNDYSRMALMPDESGAVSCDRFSVPAEQPSGVWTFVLKTPGRDGRELGRRDVKIEEFAPPQIRVAVEAQESQAPSNFTFSVSAEHLYGGPARSLGVEGAVVFEDVPFAPAAWKGFRFGNDDFGLKPSFRRLSRRTLDENGRCSFEAPLWADSGLPRAAVRATGQGTVFEDGGRPATARRSAILHYYPYYIGTTVPEWLRRPESGAPRASLVCVAPDGSLVTEPKTLKMKIERIDTVYAYRRKSDGWSTWDATRTRTVAVDGVTLTTSTNGVSEFTIPLRECGDYALTLTDTATGASFGRTFYLADWGDEAVRAPLANPTEVTILPDKAFYRPGETPRLIVKSPFTGAALLSVLRDGEVYSEVVALTNATSEITLRTAEASWAPNVDVTMSVVQGVEANARHLAFRAHGETTLAVRRAEDELEVSLDASVRLPSGGRGGAVVEAALDVASAAGGVAPDAVAVVTVVDEGINLLTGEETPDPIHYFAMPCTAAHPLYDLYHKLLPVIESGLSASGVKTGGGFGAEMLGRVSPVPTRRFKPLALWQARVPLNEGKAATSFKLPEFIGEVRVTAVVYTPSAAGSASVRRKVAPKLVAQPDAPRFVAPGDVFDVTLPISNRSGANGEVTYEVKGWHAIEMAPARGVLTLAKDASTNLFFRAKGVRTGEGYLRFEVCGFGETHASDIELPVRPAVAWRETAGAIRLEPGESVEFPASEASHRTLSLSDSPIGELSAALDWLADYPHGCLEQTASRIFPLVTSGGILATVPSKNGSRSADCIEAGVRRVESMVRANDFVMWPDCNSAPWDREVSLYAAHFLVEAEKSGVVLNSAAKGYVMKFLGRWALSTNDTVSAYACHTLALAGAPDKDRMFRLYDRRDGLSLISRARLARAFAATGDRQRAEALLANALSPASVKEASFALIAILELDPDDVRAEPLVQYLAAHRDRERFSWGTTSDNSHALMALGAYFSRRPAKGGEPKVTLQGANFVHDVAKRETFRIDDGLDAAKGAVHIVNTGDATAFISWGALTLPDVSQIKEESAGLSISRRFFTPEGTPADLADLVCGDMLVVELSLTSEESRVLSDLVVEDLFAGAFEPIHSPLDPTQFKWCEQKGVKWVMRSDARDDRMLVFSGRFRLDRGEAVKFCYPVRVVTSGEFVLPGPSVEAMYTPSLRAGGAPSRVKVLRPR